MNNDLQFADMNEVPIDLYEPTNDKVPRYTIHILDQRPHRDHGKYAAFIVPQGRYVFCSFFFCFSHLDWLNICNFDLYRETEWLFSTPQGRRKLLASAKHNRLAIVSMHRGHEYKSWDDVKDELSGSVRNFAPGGLRNQQVRLSPSLLSNFD